MNAYSNSRLRARSCDCRKPALSTFLKKEAKTAWVAGTCSSWTVSTVMAATEAQISREGLLPLTRAEIAGPSVMLSARVFGFVSYSGSESGEKREAAEGGVAPVSLLLGVGGAAP